MNEPTESAAGHEGIETLLATQTKDIIDGIRRRCHRCDGTGEEEIRDGQLIECEKCKGYGMTELNELAAALCKAQAEIEGASKDSTNPFFKSNYADLASIWTACRGPLTKHGLSVVQLPGRFADGCVEVTTMLLHESGQSITSTISTPVPQATNKKGEVIAPADPQIVGSAITYLRRYSLAAMVGVAPEDDDGEASSARASNAKLARPNYLNANGEFILPGAKNKWGGHGGKPLGELNIEILSKIYTWFLANKGEPALLQAIEEELDGRRVDESYEDKPAAITEHEAETEDMFEEASA